MLLRMGGMLLALLAVAVMRGDVRLPFGGGASGRSAGAGEHKRRRAAREEWPDGATSNGRARNRRVRDSTIRRS